MASQERQDEIFDLLRLNPSQRAFVRRSVEQQPLTNEQIRQVRLLETARIARDSRRT